MHSHCLRIAALLVSLLPMASFAAPAAGAAEYEILAPAQPTEDPSKIEVIEFFWYGCPHCYHFEPYIDAWLKKRPKDVNFIRQPAAFNKTWAQHAKAYFTAEYLEVLDKVHVDFYDEIQNKKKKLSSEDELAEFFKRHGVADKDFREAYHSFYVTAKMGQAKTMPQRYGITGTPTVVVNGKYKIKAPLDRVMVIADKLIAKERAAKK